MATTTSTFDLITCFVVVTNHVTSSHPGLKVDPTRTLDRKCFIAGGGLTFYWTISVLWRTDWVVVTSASCDVEKLWRGQVVLTYTNNIRMYVSCRIWTNKQTRFYIDAQSPRQLYNRRHSYLWLVATYRVIILTLDNLLNPNPCYIVNLYPNLCLLMFPISKFIGTVYFLDKGKKIPRERFAINNGTF